MLFTDDEVDDDDTNDKDDDTSLHLLNVICIVRGVRSSWKQCVFDTS